MSRFRLLALCVATVVAAVALGVAGATDKRPVFVVDTSSPVPGATTEVELSMAFPGTAAAENIVIAGPSEYVLAQKAIGDQVGIAAFDVRNAQRTLPRPLVGVILVADPAADTGDTVLQSCAPGTHSALWLLALRGSGTTATVPIAVDQLPTGTKITLCLDALRAAGVVPVALTFGLVDAHNPDVPGVYRWSALVTPLDAAGRPDVTNVTELRADVPLPQRLTLRASFDKRTRILSIRGALSAAGSAERGRTVHLYRELTASSGSIDLGSARTGPTGTFTRKLKLRRGVVVPAHVLASVFDVTAACAGPSSAPDGCTSETRTGVDAGPVSVAAAKG